MFQGGQFNETKNAKPLPFNPAELSGVFVTHAHLDHVGRLPLLIKNGYEGHIYATPPTIELLELILEDAFHIMQYNQKHNMGELSYDTTDIAAVMERCKPLKYNEKFSVVPGVDIILHDAGHIFGSAFIEVEAEGKKIIFSGDVGNANMPVIKDTEKLPEAIDVFVCESTYGDRLHETVTKREEILARLISEAIGRGGTLMIPSFSLERTQELIYMLNNLIDRHRILSRVPIFLDSPLAIKAMKTYLKYPDYYDQAAEKLYKAGDELFDFPGLVMTETVEESKKINNTPGPKIIIAGSGMMNGGRILHHAIRYLSDGRSTLLIIGYQAEGTLGRKILDGESPVHIMGEKIPVHCQVKAIGALSAHADQSKLLAWIKNTSVRPKKILLTHGEPVTAAALAEKITQELGIEATPVKFGMEVEV